MSCYTSSVLLAAVQSGDLAGTDREGAPLATLSSLLLPLLAMASFICHHPSYSPTRFHSRRLCLTRLHHRRWAETTPVTFVFIPSITPLPNAVIGYSPRSTASRLWLSSGSRHLITYQWARHENSVSHSYKQRCPLTRCQTFLWVLRMHIVVLREICLQWDLSYCRSSVMRGNRASAPWQMPPFRISH